MSKKKGAFFSLLLLWFFVFSIKLGKTQEAEKLVNEGRILIEQNNPKEAIKKYQEALKFDQNLPSTNYELSAAYFQLKNYKKSIKYSNRVTLSDNNLRERAYLVKGASIDLIGKPLEAIKVYQEALLFYPNNYLLFYNLALTQFNIKDFPSCEKSLQGAIGNNPHHSASHLLMAYLMLELQMKTKAILSLYRFLLVEPKGHNSLFALNLIRKTLPLTYKSNKDSISQKETQKFKNVFFELDQQLIIPPDSKSITINPESISTEVFCHQSDSFFSHLATLPDSNKDFWWKYYQNLFFDLKHQVFLETFCHYISQIQSDSNAKEWLSNNKAKLDEFADWYQNFLY